MHAMYVVYSSSNTKFYFCREKLKVIEAIRLELLLVCDTKLSITTAWAVKFVSIK